MKHFSTNFTPLIFTPAISVVPTTATTLLFMAPILLILIVTVRASQSL